MICKKCKLTKLEVEFSNSKFHKTKLRSYCKQCEKIDTARWRAKNTNKDKEVKKVYYEKNKAQIKAKIALRAKERRKRDITFKIACNLRRRLNNAIRGHNKSLRTMQLLGCTVPELKTYLQDKFVDGMTWDNYGKWHIDHIIPCSTFNFSLPSEQEKCFHFTNLQPLWAHDNLTKSAKIPTPNISSRKTT
jgi:hypothetical protein